MAGNDNTYPNSKVGILQGAQKFFVDSDGYMRFYNTDISGASLKKMAVNSTRRDTTQIISESAGVLSTLNLPASTETIIFSIDTGGASNASFWLTSGPIAGQRLYLVGRGLASTASVTVLMSGVSLVGTVNTDDSIISLQWSTNSNAFVKLECISDGEWSVIEHNNGVVIGA